MRCKLLSLKKHKSTNEDLRVKNRANCEADICIVSATFQYCFVHCVESDSHIGLPFCSSDVKWLQSLFLHFHARICCAYVLVRSTNHNYANRDAMLCYVALFSSTDSINWVVWRRLILAGQGRAVHSRAEQRKSVDCRAREDRRMEDSARLNWTNCDFT